MLIKFKWKILRYLAKKRKIKFRKMLVRIHHIQRLETLDYDTKELAKYSYKKIRILFIENFPNDYLHNPETD